MKQYTIRSLQVGVSVAILALSANAAMAVSTWVGATADPPGNNADAPITVSATAQYKEGKLSVGGFQVQDGSEGENKVLASDTEGNATWANISDLLGGESAASGVPSGAVMHFSLQACPDDWSEFTDAQGRYVVGLNSGGTLGATVGTALTDTQNVATGNHSHGVANTMRFLGYGGASGYPSYPVWDWTSSNTGAPQPTGAGVTVSDGTNAPYVQLLTCVKD